MPRRLHCPYCNAIVDAPHRPSIECPSAPPPDVENPEGVQYRGPRDDEGRPIGEAVKPDGTRVKPTTSPQTKQQTNPRVKEENISAKKTNHDD